MHAACVAILALGSLTVAWQSSDGKSGAHSQVVAGAGVRSCICRPKLGHWSRRAPIIPQPPRGGEGFKKLFCSGCFLREALALETRRTPSSRSFVPLRGLGVSSSLDDRSCRRSASSHQPWRETRLEEILGTSFRHGMETREVGNDMWNKSGCGRWERTSTSSTRWQPGSSRG